MNDKHYTRQPGDHEIRFLKDGRMVLVGPDQDLLDMAKDLSQPDADADHKERNTHDSTATGSDPVPTSQKDSDTCRHDE
ncbi:MAG: hypothetical protein K9N55_14905 [Phycisphaerae bacterium]|nr:hypothetical protein [Phycisphaerae bacterium]